MNREQNQHLFRKGEDGVRFDRHRRGVTAEPVYTQWSLVVQNYLYGLKARRKD